MPRLTPFRAARAEPGPQAGTDARPATGPRTPAEPRTPPDPAPARIGVPAFAHPLVAPAEWAELARPGAPLDWVAFDVAGGPGTRSDSLYVQALERVRENAVPVLGLLDCAHGTRPFGELVIDASHYLDWYRVDGFYLDRAPTLHAETAESRRLVSTLRALLAQEHADVPGPAGDRPRIVMAPGAYPHPGYAEIADQLVVFDGPWTRYRWSEVPQWSAGYPAARFAHLVHGLPATHLDAALRIARWQGAGTLCMTDRRGGDDGGQAWAGLPGYWTDLVRRLREQPGGAPSM